MFPATDRLSEETSVTPDDQKKLIKILGLLGSSSAGERASAALRATRLIARYDMTWEDVVGYLPHREPIEVTADMIFDRDDVEDLESILKGGDGLANDLVFETQPRKI